MPTGRCNSGLEHLGACCSLWLVVLRRGLNPLYTAVKTKADLRLVVVLVEVVVVEAPVLKCTDPLGDCRVETTM